MYTNQNSNRGINSHVPPLRHHDAVLKVIGRGEKAYTPDMAEVTIGVMTEKKELIEAQQLNSKLISNVISSLLSLGIPQHNIQTFDYRIDSEYDYIGGKQVFRGYKVTHLLKVTIEELRNIGKIVDTAVQNGANYVASIIFKSRNKEAFYRQALTMAMHDAIQKAQALTGEIKATLNPVPLYITEGLESSSLPINISASFVKGVSTTQFEPGQLIAKAEITASFQYYMT
ncbi:MAG: SIMPL domain-containing protein [Bacillota bacterium]|nr:SIMPL domain-containing protein [Bacillota bacterium]